MNRDGTKSQASDAEVAPVPTEIDTTTASIARVYDCFLGGKDNYEVDRVIFRQIDAVLPEAKILPKINRQWLIRATRFLASTAGISQFLDLGAGLPTAENTHQAAQRLNPDAHVVYVDNDPVVVAHGRALLEDNDHTHLVPGDITDPDEILGHPVVNKYLDLDRPLALMQCGTLHHFADLEQTVALMRRYVDRLPSGSYLVLSHFCDPEDDGPGTDIAKYLENALTNSSMGSGYFRTRAEIESLFCGLDLLDPGLVHPSQWWPDGPPGVLEPIDQTLLAGVAHKA